MTNLIGVEVAQISELIVVISQYLMHHTFLTMNYFIMWRKAGDSLLKTYIKAGKSQDFAINRIFS